MYCYRLSHIHVTPTKKKRKYPFRYLCLLFYGLYIYIYIYIAKSEFREKIQFYISVERREKNMQKFAWRQECDKKEFKSHCDTLQVWCDGSRMRGRKGKRSVIKILKLRFYESNTYKEGRFCLRDAAIIANDATQLSYQIIYHINKSWKGALWHISHSLSCSQAIMLWGRET